MRSPLSPLWANVNMNKIEDSFKMAPLQPTVLMRYLDDDFAIWSHGREKLRDFLQFVNQINAVTKEVLIRDNTQRPVPPQLQAKDRNNEEHDHPKATFSGCGIWGEELGKLTGPFLGTGYPSETLKASSFGEFGNAHFFNYASIGPYFRLFPLTGPVLLQTCRNLLIGCQFGVRVLVLEARGSNKVRMTKLQHLQVPCCRNSCDLQHFCQSTDLQMSKKGRFSSSPQPERFPPSKTDEQASSTNRYRSTVRDALLPPMHSLPVGLSQNNIATNVATISCCTTLSCPLRQLVNTQSPWRPTIAAALSWDNFKER
ncbi:unnamed protein product [Protopolystoma xenopodis]|uniref:Reverse transcriptase domain-containing protein n=1 Tax=Protopolystoma xenopodis TaxID=117903 RepID=A0A448XGN3_9PLAT|nr:unnamed protein product [Protopolystoma xenopodis]